MAIEIVDLPITNADGTHSYVRLPEGNLAMMSGDVEQFS